MQGAEAVGHLFKVGAGLHSPLLGDYVKQAVFFRQRGCIDGLTERMINTVIQASKAVKNRTDLSAGSVSVVLAAVKCIIEERTKCDTRILLVGTGKIGHSIARHLSH